MISQPRMLIFNDDVVPLIEYVEELLSIKIPEPNTYAQTCRDVAIEAERESRDPLGEGKKREPWSKSTWRIFFKHQAYKLGLYDPIEQPIIHEWIVGSLNVAFVGVEETNEQLALLRMEATELLSQTARSKLSQTNHFPKPIDLNAARVTYNANIPAPSILQRLCRVSRLQETRKTTE